ncbi:MAG TPA: hypothetical protein GXZ29_00855 [Clostridiales bacterium]|nr:hypothetical protein [Clostridiales bacterium]
MYQMGLTTKQIQQIEQDFMSLPVKERLDEVLEVMKDCSPEEQLCLKFMYAYMPASDLTTYNVSLFLNNLRDTLAIIQTVPWGSQITGELFLNYVLPLRINNENLVDHRLQFFNEIYPRVQHLSIKDAVLEVNYWCLEKATYKSTDIRTSSPLNVIRNAFGRCGEESVLCVAALRSVGIPARQCYTPRWAHCDDNHAWVEVWVDGDWHFIGACEPEPVLDKGWFTEAAQRGMLIHARVFSRLVSEPHITHQTPVMSQINILNNYAETKILRVFVIDEEGLPVKDAEVRFELINFAQLFPLAVLKTDVNGEAHLLTGRGDLSVHVSKDGRFLYKKADHSCTELHFCLADARYADTEQVELDLVPPTAGTVKDPELPEHLAKHHEIRTNQANTRRTAFEDTFLQGNKAEDFAAKFDCCQKEISELIALSNGNHPEITAFLDAEIGIALKYKVLLLSSLRDKDLSDITCTILQNHLLGAMAFWNQFTDSNEDVFVKYVLCPRVHYEMITDYRDVLYNYFTDNQKILFRQEPQKIFEYIESNVRDCGEREYGTITSSPEGLLKYKYGSKLSRKILFVAICRTLGIPARLSEIDRKLEYWKNDRWHTISEEVDIPIHRCCKLTLYNNQPDVPFVYGKNFTIARLENGRYHTLGLYDYQFDGESISYELEEGKYRVTTANRLLDGTILASLIHVELDKGEEQAVTIHLREPDVVMDEKVALPEIPVLLPDGKQSFAQKLLLTEETGVIAFIEEGKEPTEHLLNEIHEQKEEFARLNKRMLLLIKNKDSLKDRLLNTVLDSTGILVALRDMTQDAFPSVLQALNTQNNKLPLVLALDTKKRCVFHTSGYNVGTGDMLLKHLR